MLLTVPVLAQKKSTLTLKWEIAHELPADSGQLVSLGIAGPVTGTHNDMLLIGGGANFPEAMPWDGGLKKYYTTVYAYSLSTRKLKLFSKTFNLPHSIAYAASCSTREGLLYAGGENEYGISNLVWLLEWDDKAKEIRFKELPSLPEPVSNAAITLTGNTVYLAGGENSRQTTAQFLSLNLSNIKAGWIKLADIPHPVSHTVLTAVTGTTGNRIYLSGGRKKNNNGISDLFSEVFAYDIAANTWDQKKSLPYPLSAGTGLFHDSNSILLFGGDKGAVFHQAETLIAAINTEKDTMKKNGMIREKINLQSSHPGFSREVLRYDLNNDTWVAAGTIPYETPVTTTAVETNKGIIIPSGEIRAGVRSPKILKLLIRRKTK